MKLRKQVVLPLVVALLIFAAGFGIGRFSNQPPATESIKQVRQSTLSTNTYQFINPLLLVDTAEDTTTFKPLKDNLVSLVNQAIKSKSAEQISIYFDRRNGKWFGINDEVPYSPASLMKVPLMVSFLKSAETNPSLLSKEVSYNGTTDLNQDEFFKTKNALVPGSVYTIEDLIGRMIKYSDNNALLPLSNNITGADISSVSADFGVKTPADQKDSQSDFVSVKTYANFFRILYNSTYLSRDMSEKALSLLSQTTFTNGIVAGVPNGIVVAHKFGERAFGDAHDPNSEKELHDCGVVYFPKNRYILCVMTKGQDYNSLASSIKDISKAVYDYIDQTFGK